MKELIQTRFDPAVFLAQAGLGRRVVQIKPKQAFFSQGDPADCIFYLQSGRAKLTVVSMAGKEATVTLLVAGDFVGEEALASPGGLRLATALSMTATNSFLAPLIHHQTGFRQILPFHHGQNKAKQGSG